MTRRALIAVLVMAFPILLTRCDTENPGASSQRSDLPAKELNIQDFEPDAQLERKAKKYALKNRRQDDGASDPLTRTPTRKTGRDQGTGLNLEYHAEKSLILKFESRQEFKAYKQVVANLSRYENEPVRIHKSMKKYLNYRFISAEALQALNHEGQVVIDDTLYSLRGKKQVETPLNGGKKTETTLDEITPAPNALPPGEGGGDSGAGGGGGDQGQSLGQCVEIIGWRNSYNSVDDTGDPCYTGDRQTRYYPQRIDLPNDALSYAGDRITGIRIRPLNTIGSGEDGFLGQTNRTGSAHSKVVLLGQNDSYQLGVDNLDANKLSGDVVVDISVTISEESCYFGYCYCTSSNITNDERRVIAETEVGTDFRPINSTGSNAGPYAVSAVAEDRCGGKGVTSWHGIEIDGRQYPTYYDGRLFTQDPTSGDYFLRENSDPIFKLRGGCGNNNQSCGARPGNRL